LAVSYIDRVLRGVRGVTPVEKLIIVILADYARAPGGMSWPSVGTVAWEAGIAHRYASEMLAKLRASGWIEVVGSTRGGRGKSTCYRLNLPRIVEFAERAKDERKRMVKGRAKDEPRDSVSRPETMNKTAAKDEQKRGKDEQQGTETMNPSSPEPLGLAVITSTGISRTSNPSDKSLTQKPENHMTREQQLAWCKAQIAPQLHDAHVWAWKALPPIARHAR